MKITCMQCDTPFETTKVTGKYIFCPWCGKRLLNPRFSEKKRELTATRLPEYNSTTSTITTLFDENANNKKIVDIFGRPINPSRFIPQKRMKIRLFIQRTNDNNSF